ncbi:sigma-70 family RNA polymerase sigma factor [Gilvimarinus agarilyticus]|uniref:RNA polymerase sigma factor n=1 Tax=unclassified Gilvimarinus TaxID=2642066 RepID=UPI001C083676|nr:MULTISPECIES: sigma-70 family RNA polymerase sigma factor [unclassified Gilvimarinus]MBU2884286.1 sigma-70 family RNA polymerase sigma factor [Gilvimarinus agarilyticus]MDO6569424.1 sigma-70 family RNA polymerase sigma factor [Gilvimarinus sp. 2_MG-2023]MDO6747578.1 sigma-70 family RNA polymerase sigma factor [Gilvimarinus sp. 1_MG-2023]
MTKKESLESIYMSVRKGLIRAVSGMVPPKEIEDIVQETYVRVCTVKNSEQISHPRSFLYRTARNLALDYLKRSETRLAVSTEDDSVDLDRAIEKLDQVYDQVAAKQEFEHFCEAVRHLPLQCRKVFVLKKVYGYTQKEIAQQLNISENTVEKHIASGLRRCQKHMQQNLPGTTKRQGTSTSQEASQ